MAKFYEKLTDKLIEFIAQQKMFFVASAPEIGRVNLSPKGMDTFCVFDAQTVGYLDLTGSGNETAAHIADNGRVTIMFCSFTRSPLILRLYGQGRVILPNSADWPGRSAHWPPVPGTRQIIELAIESVQTSCGYAVPFFEFAGPRNQLVEWSQKKGPDALQEYRQQKNTTSIDGQPITISETNHRSD